MNCLCCGKPLEQGQGEMGWHRACVRRFFGTAELPQLDLGEQQLQQIVLQTVRQGYTVPGVQRKMSLHLFSGAGRPRLTIVDMPAGYILKPQVAEYTALPEAEHLVMHMAAACGISVVPHALLQGEGGYAYITRRVDRIRKGDMTYKLAMEDFCQLDLRLTQDKYKGSYERCAKVIQRYSAQPGLDLTELYMRLLFSFLVGNSDMHLKNFSLLETAEGSGVYQLSPAYDVLPVNVILPADREQFALTMRGKKRHLRRGDFLRFADSIGVPPRAAEHMLRAMLRKVPQLLRLCEASCLPQDMQGRLGELIRFRAAVLAG